MFQSLHTAMNREQLVLGSIALYKPGIECLHLPRHFPLSWLQTPAWVFVSFKSHGLFSNFAKWQRICILGFTLRATCILPKNESLPREKRNPEKRSRTMKWTNISSKFRSLSLSRFLLTHWSFKQMQPRKQNVLELGEQQATSSIQASVPERRIALLCGKCNHQGIPRPMARRNIEAIINIVPRI